MYSNPARVALLEQHLGNILDLARKKEHPYCLKEHCPVVQTLQEQQRLCELPSHTWHMITLSLTAAAAHLGARTGPGSGGTTSGLLTATNGLGKAMTISLPAIRYEPLEPTQQLEQPEAATATVPVGVMTTKRMLGATVATRLHVSSSDAVASMRDAGDNITPQERQPGVLTKTEAEGT